MPRSDAPPVAMRIACLVPSVTELLVELGLAPWLVARTGFCIHPRDRVAGIAKVGGTKDVNMAKLRQLAPTHVVVNVDENEKSCVDELAQFVPRIIVTHPCAPQDVLGLIDQITEAFAQDLNAINSIANNLMNTTASRLKAHISEEIGYLQTQVTQHEQVLYLIWREPWMTVAQDTYISRMLALIGWQTWPCVDGGDKGAARYPALKGQESWLRQIDRVLLSSEPYSFKPEHVHEVRTWLQTFNPAVKVQLVDGELLSWYGSRALHGLRYLRELARS
jgi:ABC-type Fe3+-hydroxamate transport system substrate-binding protein